MRICARCGKGNSDTNRYCAFCSADMYTQRTGTQLLREGTTNLPQKTSLLNGKWWIAVLGATIVFIVAGMIAVLISQRNNSSASSYVPMSSTSAVESFVNNAEEAEVELSEKETAERRYVVMNEGLSNSSGGSGR